jgi:RES domain
VELVAFRLANYETPLWAVPNFAAGRYNEPDTGSTQYLSLHPLTPWAELLRNEDRRTREQAILMRYPLWALRLEFDTAPLDLTFDNAHELGLSPGDLVADDHTPCRELARRWRTDGPSAFIAPSAALPGTRNLIVLEPHVLISWEQVPIEDIDWPGSLASQDGRCPEGLWELVHYRATRAKHPALRAWRRGAAFTFEEPLVSPSSLAA